MFETYEVLLIVICVTGTGLLPIGIHISSSTHYWLSGVLICIFGVFCGAVSFAMLLDLVFKGLNV